MKNSEYILTAIVPVSAMSGKLQNFQSWTKNIPQNIKIVVVHDRRDDATGEELKSIIAGKSNIQYIEGVYGSAGLARNAGLELSSTKWTTFWDSDDLPEIMIISDSLARETTSKDIIVFSFSVKSQLSHEIIRISSCPNGGIKTQLNYLAYDPGIWRIVFRTEIVSRIKFSDLKIGEDVLFLAEALAKSNEIKFKNEIVYNYFRDVPNQLTGSNNHLSEIPKLIANLNRSWLSKKVERCFVVPLIIKQLGTLVLQRTELRIIVRIMFKNNILRSHPVLFLKHSSVLLYTYMKEKLQWNQ